MHDKQERILFLLTSNELAGEIWDKFEIKFGYQDLVNVMHLVALRSSGTFALRHLAIVAFSVKPTECSFL